MSATNLLRKVVQPLSNLLQLTHSLSSRQPYVMHPTGQVAVLATGYSSGLIIKQSDWMFHRFSILSAWSESRNWNIQLATPYNIRLYKNWNRATPINYFSGPVTHVIILHKAFAARLVWILGIVDLCDNWDILLLFFRFRQSHRPSIISHHAS